MKAKCGHRFDPTHDKLGSYLLQPSPSFVEPCLTWNDEEHDNQSGTCIMGIYGTVKQGFVINESMIV